MESDDEDPLDMSRSLRYHLETVEETNMEFKPLKEHISEHKAKLFYVIKGTAPMPPDQLLPENDPGDLDSDYTHLQHLQARLKTEDQLAKKAGKKNG